MQDAHFRPAAAKRFGKHGLWTPKGERVPDADDELGFGWSCAGDGHQGNANDTLRRTQFLVGVLTGAKQPRVHVGSRDGPQPILMTIIEDANPQQEAGAPGRRKFTY